MEKFEMIRRIKLQLSGVKIKKEGFPIPSPESNEDEQKYISRCNSELYDEYPDDAQRNAICYSKWNEK